MSTLPNKKTPEHNKRGQNPFNGKGNSTNTADLLHDPDYQVFLDAYQNTEYVKCADLLGVLKSRYPNNPNLLRFEEDLQMRLSFMGIADSNKKKKRKNKVKATFKLSLYTVFGTLFVFVIAFLSYVYFNGKVTARQDEQEAVALASLNEQAEELLLVGKPNSALQIIEKIKEIDPDYSNLENLTNQTEILLTATAKYETAQNLLSEGRSDEALAVLKEIDSEYPGLWDVRLLINSIETATRVDILINEASSAYENQAWDQAITAYENAIQLKSDETSEYTEQLLNSYLNQIVAMLQNKNASVEEIDQAQEYYRKAMALAPQSKTFENERAELQSISASLLEQKYAQTAKAILEDKNQDEQSLARAIAFLRKGEGIDPENDSAQIDLESAEAYQVAFSNFVDQDWIHSVENLETVYANNPDFANGNAGVLLYEAYFALGMQYYNANFNQDALKYFEQAEILAWDDTANPAKLFQVQIYIGHTLGRIGEYENAVSYYEYALESIRFSQRVSDEPALANQYAVANGYNAVGDYNTAYTTYTELFNQVGSVYSINQAAVEQGVLLAFFASEHQSTVALILEANDLPNTMVAPSNQILTIPTISG